MGEELPFEAIASYVASHDNFLALSSDRQLYFYGLYKGAIEGLAPQYNVLQRIRMYFVDQTAYRKWASWDVLSDGYSKEAAIASYCKQAAAIGAYPDEQQLRIMQSSARNNKGSSTLLNEDIPSNLVSDTLDSLIAACEVDDIETIKSYVDSGGEVNAQNEEGTCLIHFAVDHKATQVIHFLLNSPRLEVNAVDDQGHTALHLAAINGDEWLSVGQQLMLHKADASIRDANGQTPAGHLIANGLNPRKWFIYEKTFK